MGEESDGHRLLESTPVSGYSPIAIVLVCLGVVLLSMTLVPLVTATGHGGAPAESLIPVLDEESNVSVGGSKPVPGSGSGGFGALNPGQRQNVGGAGDSPNPFRSLNTTIHFRVQTDTPSYWRTGSYDRYDGTGWTKSGPSDGSTPMTGETVEYRVDLAEPSISPPVVWRPVSISGNQALSLSERGEIQLEDAYLDENSSYEGQSTVPPRSTTLLASSGRGYPGDLADRYTQLPDETESALTGLTTNVTAGADNPYETADRIETWLEESKSYSLDVSRPEGDIAAEFVHNMSAGYCEYFATAMVAMLRTQDIPARYVVGYSTGQQLDADTFRVRAMNAHAWVEVYFADVGWVRFDPTPGSARIEREEEAYLESNATGQYAPAEPGSPGETNSATNLGGSNESSFEQNPIPENPTEALPPEAVPDTSTPQGNLSGPDRFRPYSIRLNRTQVPGASVEISYIASPFDFSEPVPVTDARIFLNGSYVGRTDSAGTVSTTVPYAKVVNITAVGGLISRGAILQRAIDPSRLTISGDGVRLTDFNQSSRLQPGTNGSIRIEGDPTTNETVQVRATISNVSIRHGVVRVGDSIAGRTAGNGSANVRMPASPGNVSISVRRGPVRAETRVELPALRVSVDPITDLPIAGTVVIVNATLGDEPAADVPVRMNGEVVGYTNERGRYEGIVPFKRVVSISVASNGQTVSQTLTDPLVNASVVWPLVVGILLGVVYRRRVLAAVAAKRSESKPIDLLWRVGLGTRQVIEGRRSIDDVLVAGTQWTGGAQSRRPEASTERVTAGSPAPIATAAPREAAASGTTIGAAWEYLLSVVSEPEVETKTPTQIASSAIGRDRLPREPVETVRNAFLAVEYGPKSADDVTASVTAAIDELEDAIGDSEAPDGDGAAGAELTEGTD